MASLREMRRRTASVKNIRQITKAMKMVAAARLRKAQDAILAARPFARGIKDVLDDIASRADVSSVPLLRESGGRKTILFVITADKGLCGSFNANILRRATRFVTEHPEKEFEVVAIGRKGRDFFKRRGFTVRKGMLDVFRNLQFETAMTLRDEIIDSFFEGDVGEVYMIFNEFKSAMAQEIVCRQLLPVQQADQPDEKNPVEFEFEPSAAEVYSELLPEYFAIQIWNALLESYSAELGARMTAMESATKNASDMIAKLTLVSNRLRQANITKELAEIVGGAEALN